MTLVKGQQSPRHTVTGQSGISIEKDPQESPDTHLLQVLQAYLIRAWQQQGWTVLCLENPESCMAPAPHSRFSISSCSFQPLDLLHLVCGDSKPRNKGWQWRAQCPLGVHTRIADTVSSA